MQYRQLHYKCKLGKMCKSFFYGSGWSLRANRQEVGKCEKRLTDMKFREV